MKILHTADLHLDSPFEGLSPGKAASRRSEQRELLERIASAANSEKADVVFLCGDLLDSESSYYETGEALVNSLRRIAVPVFIAPGNHDYYSDRSPYAKLDFPENVHVFRKSAIESFNLPWMGCRVFGGAFTDRNDPELLKDFRADREDDMLNLMCIHGSPSEASIADSGMDYVALGHIHKPTGLLRAGNVYYSQPGCPEGRGFDETGDRFVNSVEISRTGCSMKQIKVSLRNYEILEVDVSDSDPVLAVKYALPDDTVRDIYRIVFKGQTDRAIDESRIKNALSEYFFELQIKDRTTLKRDIWDKCGEDTLRGLFLSKLKKQYDESVDESDREFVEKAVRWGLAAIDNMEEVKHHDN